MKPKWTYLFLMIVVVAATVAVGAIHGRMTLRWGHRADMLAAAALLEDMPTQCGDWRMKASADMSNSEIEMLRCAGYVARQYVNEKTGESVSLGIVFGPPGPISEHTPEVCFSTREYTKLGARQRIALPTPANAAEADEFWGVDFRKNGIASANVRVYWGWSSGGAWSAPEKPKRAFAGSRHLYKIQLSTTVLSGVRGVMPSAPDDSCGRFLEEFLPVSRPHIVADAPIPANQRAKAGEAPNS